MASCVALDFIPDEILPPPSLGSYLLVSPPWMAVMSELQEHIQTMQSSHKSLWSGASNSAICAFRRMDASNYLPAGSRCKSQQIP
jgi:hypothetical protein